jgi:hypothetical protein
MMIPRLIAICGYKRSGKDTLAEFIVSNYGHKHVKVAEKLKKITKLVFNFSDEQIESDTKENVDPRWGISPRAAMQFIGTEMFQYKIQELLPDIQRKLWIKGIVEEIEQSSTSVVISDLRFVHEYEELKKQNVFVIRVTRPNMTIAQHDNHSSETEFLKIPADLVVENIDIHSMFSTIRHTFHQSN